MTHIRYIDGNNLYGSQMLFNLPTEDYRFEDIKFIRKMERKLRKGISFNLKNRGMFLEVDLVYPKKLHTHHRDFPLAHER